MNFYCIVAGSRTFNDYDLLEHKLNAFLSVKKHIDQAHIVIVSGGAKGADALAERYAKEKGYELKVFKADWNLYGKSAGYRRNEQMHRYVSQFEDRGCVCFWNQISKGTTHNFILCEKYKTPLRVVAFKE